MTQLRKVYADLTAKTSSRLASREPELTLVIDIRYWSDTIILCVSLSQVVDFSSNVTLH